MHNPGYFHQRIEAARAAGELLVQPRMGFSAHDKMRAGLEAVRDAAAPTLGTVTVDSMTRTFDFEGARRAVLTGSELNGYPIVSYSESENRSLLDGVQSAGFPVQVRHGTARPTRIFDALIEAGIDATEGGPISYCLPYSRVPLAESIDCWAESCKKLAALAERGTVPHLESFGGCMLGQLCPPSLLVAITLLEGLFSVRKGITSLSLSYAQGYNAEQDLGALLALRRLAREYLPDADWHVVVYTFMGMFPTTPKGARRILEESARLARASGSERLIVKTPAEAHHIPTIEGNVEALLWAHEAARRAGAPAEDPGDSVRAHAEITHHMAKSLVDAVLDLAPSLDDGLRIAFERGYLDVPYCIHPDNRNRARVWLDPRGNVQWAATGSIPFPANLKSMIFKKHAEMSSEELLGALAFHRDRYDGTATVPEAEAAFAEAGATELHY